MIRRPLDLLLPPRPRPLHLIPGILAAGRIVDPLFGNVVSLLHFDGTNASTTFTDQKGVTWTPAGNAQLSTTTPKFGTACMLLDGTGDWIGATVAAFAFGTGNFTIECWVRFDSTTGNRFCFTWGGGYGLYQFSTSWALFNGATNDTTGLTALTGQYYHAAVCRSGTTMRMFINGVQAGGNVTNSTNFTNQSIRIGAQPSGSGALAGRIDDFRVTTAARYTANFTPPAVAFPNA